MNLFIRTLLRTGLAITVAALSPAVFAQFALSTAQLVPATPTSGDTTYLRLNRPCGASQELMTPAYFITKTAAGMDVNLRYASGSALNCTRPAPVPADPILIELGKLPAGNYTVNVRSTFINGAEAVLLPALAGPVNFSVLDRRSQSQPPFSRVNYSDHWWDAADSGAGFMIWHNSNDQFLTVWFTYGPDGKASWYTVQSGSWVTPTRYDGLLITSSRPPGEATAGFPEVANTESAVIGSATVDFGLGDGSTTARLSYHITNTNIDVVRNLRRFGK